MEDNRVTVYEFNLDREKAKTFFLQIYRNSRMYARNYLRYSESTYEEYVDVSKTRIITIGPAYITFDTSVKLSEMIIECALRGISIDFIEVIDDVSGKRIEFVDCHKRDVRELLGKIEFPQYYVVLNSKKKDPLKFLLIDRFKQDSNIDFLKGEYDVRCSIAGFKEMIHAERFCKEMNKYE